ncbi:MAG TPA: hypothetical protein VK210_09095 [Terriglobia bacterium]|nr:hypothetical protein [Terriglobia bacterium]
MKPLIMALAVATMFQLALPASASAQQPNEAAQNELIQTLLKRIDQLERRVADLEPPKAPAATRPAASMAGMTMPHPESQPALEGPNLKIAGFSDINFSASDQPASKSGFNEGQFILHMNSNLSSKVTFLGELSLSARGDAGTGTPAATGFNAEVERSLIRYDYNDYLKVSFGRFHTPINYWNTAFHHGQWLQTTASRPEMTQFGGRFIPVHFVGALAEGAVGAGGLNFNYNFGVGNGRGAVISRGGDAGDNNNNRAWLVNLFVKPDRLYGLRLGGSMYRDRITNATNNVREWITSAHVVWTRETPEIIAEFANVNHENITTPSPRSNSQAYYIQAGYRLPMLEKRWKPYYRFEYIHIPLSDTLFQSQGVPNLAGSVAGLRYDISTFAAFKFEYRNQRRAPNVPRVNSGFLQTSFTF